MAIPAALQAEPAPPLRVVVEAESAGLLSRSGELLRPDRDLARAFARAQGRELRFVPVLRRSEMLPMLRLKEADLVAGYVPTVTEAPAGLRYSRRTSSVDELLIAPAIATSPPDDIAGLSGRQVHALAGSAQLETLRGLAAGAVPGLEVVAVPEPADAETLIYEVARGRRPLALVDARMVSAVEPDEGAVKGLFTLNRARPMVWVTRAEDTVLLEAANAFLLAHAVQQDATEAFAGDLREIRRRGMLRVLTRNNGISYFIHRGRPYGLDYELAAHFAEQLDLRLSVVVPPSREALIPWLREGRGDLIAATLSDIPERRTAVRFSRPYLRTREALVIAPDAPLPEGLRGLAGRQIHTRASSSYFETLRQLQPRFGPFEIVRAPEELETEILIEQVLSGELEATVADEYIVDAMRRSHPEMRAPLALDPRATIGSGSEEAMGPPQATRIAWALRPQNAELLRAADRYLAGRAGRRRLRLLRRRYLGEGSRRISRAREDRAARSGTLSDYDALLRNTARAHALDWRLVAAVAYTESRFDPKARSWAGARGLMQVLPATAREMGFDDPAQPAQSVGAGVKYLKRLMGRFEDDLPADERIFFALAAYNAGLGHVIDARLLAARLGHDPDRWFGHVERAMLLLQHRRYHQHARYGYARGSETVAYVAAIRQRYLSYTKVVPL